MKAELLEQLQKNPLQNMPVKGFFENYPLEKHFIYGKSMILLGTSDYPWAYLAADNPDELDILLEKFDFESLYFANVEEWMLAHLTIRHRIEWRLSTHRYYLPEETEVNPPLEDNRSLNPETVRYIFDHSPYKDYTSESYIRSRIKQDISAGIWIDDELAAWGLTHDDGSLGFLNVISPHRGKGLGESVFRTLVLAKKAAGKPVFVNVESHNKQSISLLTKLGLVYDRQVSWVKLA